MTSVELKKVAALNFLDPVTGRSALHLASQANDTELMNALIGAGADVNIKDKDGGTALLTACRNERADIPVRILLVNGADVSIKDKDGATALLAACQNNQAEIVKMLVEHGAAVNVKDKDGATALLAACQNNQAEIVKMLVKHGAAVNIKEKSGYAILRELANKFASQYDRVKSSDAVIFAQLISAEGISQDGSWLLERLLSFDSGAPGYHGRVYDSQDYSGRRKPICIAMIKSLLLAGVDPAGQASNGEPLLTLAINRGFREAALLLVKAMKGEPL
eukprot:jgi/Mesvir1/19614/Mv09909-RA.1